VSRSSDRQLLSSQRAAYWPVPAPRGRQRDRPAVENEAPNAAAVIPLLADILFLVPAFGSYFGNAANLLVPVQNPSRLR